jgi:ribosomal protein S20
MTNAAIKYLGELDKTLGVSKQFAEFSQWFADNIQTVAALLTGLGVAMGIAFSASLIQKFTVAIRALWALLLANPFVAVAAAIAGVLSYLYIMRDEIKLGIDDTTTLGDLMRAAWESIAPAIQAVADVAATFFGWLTDTGAGTFDELLNQTVGYQHEAEATWLKLLRVVVQVFDMIGAVIRGTFMGVNAVIQNFIGAWMNNFRQLGNAIDGIKELDAGKIKDAVAANLDGYKQAATGAGAAFSEAFNQEVLSQSEHGLEALLDKTIARAQEIGKERAAAAKPGGVDLSQALGGGGGAGGEDASEAAKKAARELERLKNELDRLVGAIDPVKGAMMDLAAAEDTFNRAIAKGLITKEEAARYMAKMREDYRDALDPLGALNRELERQTDILRLGNREREVEEQLFRDTEQLRRAGILLTEEETAKLRAKLTAMQELSRVMEYQNSLMEQGVGNRGQDFDAWLQGIQGAQAQGSDQFGAQLGSLFLSEQDAGPAQLLSIPEELLLDFAFPIAEAQDIGLPLQFTVQCAQRVEGVAVVLAHLRHVPGGLLLGDQALGDGAIEGVFGSSEVHHGTLDRVDGPHQPVEFVLQAFQLARCLLSGLGSVFAPSTATTAQRLRQVHTARLGGRRAFLADLLRASNGLVEQCFQPVLALA